MPTLHTLYIVEGKKSILSTLSESKRYLPYIRMGFVLRIFEFAHLTLKNSDKCISKS